MVVFSLLATLALSGVQNERPEPPIGSRIPGAAYEEEQADPATRADTFAVVERLGACVVNANAQGSMALLMTNPGTDTGAQALNKLKPFLPDCLVKATQGTELYGTLKLQIDTPVLRGAVAATLYRLQFERRPPSAFPKPAAVALIMPPEESDPKAAKWIAWYSFTQCLTEARPDEVRQFVASKPGSSEEVAALSQLRAFMPPCVSTGTTVKTDRNNLRFILADSLYRWSITAAQSPGATSKLH